MRASVVVKKFRTNLCLILNRTEIELFESTNIKYLKDMKKEIELDATQWFIELMIRSTCFGHYYAHHQELDTIQIFTACGT